ncbi:hypothetical protein LIER_36018 [Lithospermum erythrorhizon]|uniref:Uncharacterized protein n=1 Tax=Lithospermum erythrorhizon TaxID=34254 RepID=A0AAV3P0S5_LITER
MVKNYSPLLTTVAASFSVVDLWLPNGLKLRVSLSANNSNSFTIDPLLCDVLALKSWCDTVREMELPALLVTTLLHLLKILFIATLLEGIPLLRSKQSSSVETFGPAKNTIACFVIKMACQRLGLEFQWMHMTTVGVSLLVR